MRFTNFAEFDSSFPDDSVEHENEIVAPDGEALMRAISEQLREVGHFISGFDQHSFYGWTFEVVIPGKRCWLLLQRSDRWLLQVNDPPLIFGKPRFASFLDVCRKCLVAVPEISSVRWMTRKEFESQV